MDYPVLEGCYTPTQIIEIYNETQSTDPEVLMEEGRRMFPDIELAQPLKVVTEMMGRWFPTEKGGDTYGPPKCTIKNTRGAHVGIAQDGTAYPY